MIIIIVGMITSTVKYKKDILEAIVTGNVYFAQKVPSIL